MDRTTDILHCLSLVCDAQRALRAVNRPCTPLTIVAALQADLPDEARQHAAILYNLARQVCQ